VPLRFLRIADACDTLAFLAYAPDAKASTTNNANNKAANFINIPRIKDHFLVKVSYRHKSGRDIIRAIDFTFSQDIPIGRLMAVAA
jgi:hypothetical protein